MGLQEYISRLQNLSHQKILFANNFVLALCSIFLSTYSLYICILFSDASKSNSSGGNDSSAYIGWLCLCIVGLALATICIIGMRGAHIVSLELLIIYFWGVIVFIAPLILGVVICFNFLFLVQVYVAHHWDLPSFSKVRSYSFLLIPHLLLAAKDQENILPSSYL